MASRQKIPSAKRSREASKQEKRPDRIKKVESRKVRRSDRIARLQDKCEDKKSRQRHSSVSRQEPHLPPVSVNAPKPPPISHNILHSKRRREQEARGSCPQASDQPPSKRSRTLPASSAAEREPEKAGSYAIETWLKNHRWPKEYFEEDSQVQEEFEHDSWLEEQMEDSNQVVQYVEINGNRYPRPIRKLPTSLRRKQSDSSLTGSSDQKKRESKAAPYRDTRYATLLEAKGGYMREFDDDDIPKSTREICQKLLEGLQDVPQGSLFRDDLFKRTCREIEDRNEAMVIQDIARLLVPSAKTLSIYGAKNLDRLIENVNEGWTGSIPVCGPRPQPDYCVGFRRSAFTEEQLRRLDPLVGTVYDTSFFVATYRMYFPFLTCEVKCGAAALDVADRQNAHSMTIAVRGVIELYRALNRENELHREILAFSISHDHRAVRIYGHYPVIDGRNTTFYRHLVRTFDFTELDGKEKWTAYKFTKNVYDVWMPLHLKRLYSVIDQLPPNLDFEVSRDSELRFSEASGLSQQLGDLLSEETSIQSASETGYDDADLAPISTQTDTPDTSVSRGKERPKPKRPKRNHAVK